MQMLVAALRPAHKPAMTALFDLDLRARRRDRAARIGTETFLHDRAFDDIVERLASHGRRFPSLLLAGCPNAEWPKQLHALADEIVVVDPGPIYARRAGGICADLESLPFNAHRFDACITIGLLETANQLELAAAALHLVLRPAGFLIGAIAGGDSLPATREAMLAADQGQARPHVHPRIDGPSLGQLLTAAGFDRPVIDVDRVTLTYPTFSRLVSDFRAMAATNILLARSRQLGRSALDAAEARFAAIGRTERVDLLHFAAWTPAR